jgi:tRNA (cytidine/uridine-2'-O-)-methyltransferase
MIRVALIEPEIPWNTGNVGRTCLAGGAELHLVKPLGFSLDEAAVRRSGLDYWQHVNPRLHENVDAFLSALPGLGEPYFLSTKGARTLYEVEWGDDVIFIFGRETSGLPERVRATVAHDRLVRLPILSPHGRSLNLSTAVGITLYEALRRKSHVT